MNTVSFVTLYSYNIAINPFNPKKSFSTGNWQVPSNALRMILWETIYLKRQITNYHKNQTEKPNNIQFDLKMVV